MIFYLEIAMTEIKIVTFLLLTVLVSRAANYYLTGKVQEEHLFEQREMLVKDVFDCSERPKVSLIDISLIENLKRLYHCLRERVHHCDGRRRDSLQSAQLVQDKSPIYCNNIIYKGAYTTHEEQTFHVQMWSNFIIHIDCLLFDLSGTIRCIMACLYQNISEMEGQIPHIILGGAYHGPWSPPAIQLLSPYLRLLIWNSSCIYFTAAPNGAGILTLKAFIHPWYYTWYIPWI